MHHFALLCTITTMSYPSAATRAWGKCLGVFGACMIFALAMQWNRIMPLDGGYPWGGDYGQMVWNLWVVNEAAHHGVNPLLTKMVFWPSGANLTHHSLASGFLPLTAAVDLVTRHSPYYPFIAMRLGTWLCYALLLMLPWLVLRELGFGRLVSAIPAIGYAFCSFYLHHYHLTMLSGFFIPLIALLLLRWYRAPTRGRSVAAALGIGVSVYFTEFSAFCAVALLLMLAVLCRRRDGRRELLEKFRAAGLRTILLAAGVAIASAAPFLVTFATAPQVIAPNPVEHIAGSADLLALLTPSYRWGSDVATPLYGHWFDSISSRLHGVVGGYEAFIGFPMLLLAGIGLAGGRQNPGFVNDAAWMALIFFMLALGPVLHVLGRNTHVSLPYALLPLIPPFNLQRAPVRLVTFGIFFLTVVAAQGATRIAHALSPTGPKEIETSGWRRIAAPLALVGFLAWTIAECYSPRTPWGKYHPPAALSDVAPGRVLDLPISAENGFGVMLQVFHHRPMLTGYLARDTPKQRRAIEGLLYAYRCGPEPFADWLQRFDVKTVIVSPIPGVDPFFDPPRTFLEDLAKRIRVIDLHDYHPRKIADFGAKLTNGMASDSPGATEIAPGQSLIYSDPGGILAGRLEILADANHTYRITLLSHGRAVKELAVGVAPTVGLQWRCFMFDRMELDAIRITPVGSKPLNAVGRVTLWDL